MCGIVGAIGADNCQKLLLEGLMRLEYRGYDSAGIAVFDGRQIEVVRAEGKLFRLAEALEAKAPTGSLGIGHTRWATHGKPSEQNAHPHKAGGVAVVHNGIIENHLALKKTLMAEGCEFQSETDTEILSHLIHREIKDGKNLAEAVRVALQQVEGSYAIAVISESEPDKLIAARSASPLVIGVGEQAGFLASDVAAILQYTRDFLYLDDEEIAILTSEGVQLMTLEGKPIERETKRVDWTPAMAEKDGYKHYMLKEIFEQPRAVADTLRGRVSLEQGDVLFDGFEAGYPLGEATKRIVIVACGTSWHAALVGKFWIEANTRLPVEVDLGSEFRYREPVIDEHDLLIAISQSGETADTLAAVKLAKARGAKVLAICNVVESSLARFADFTAYTHAGPEIGVASTKAFVTQLTMLYLLAIGFARRLGLMDARRAAHKLLELVRLPVMIDEVLQNRDKIASIAERFHRSKGFLFLGRWVNYPIALEGALKLKEISYIHAEGYPSGEMKHGPIALIDEKLPVVSIITKNRLYEKALSNVQEVQARRGAIIAMATEGDEEITAIAEEVVFLPSVEEELEPILTAIPMQLFAYYIADFNGTDVDQPRNLAKSVTVE